MSDTLSSFVELAIRLVLDNVSYSNPLPDRYDPPVLDFDLRSTSISRRLEAYLSGRAKPLPPTTVLVPRRDRSTQKWSLPSVNDQIILQVAASAIADALRQRPMLDSSRVFSYAANTDPTRLALNDSQFSSWLRFQHATRERLPGVRMLQLDLENAFSSIDIVRFLTFCRHISPRAADLLRSMLRVFSPTDRGLPRINDSLFFLGNVYFRVIDEVVSRHTSDWIRFVDDYRIFGKSDDELNEVLSRITRDLAPLGCRPNSRKTRLGSEEEYLEAIGKLRYAKSTTEHYISAAVFDDVVEPAMLFDLCRKAVDAPEELMHEGTGRYILQSLRRMKTNSDIAAIQNQPHSPRAVFRREASDPRFFDRVGELILECARGGDQWRLVWLLYLVKVIVPGDEQESDDMDWPPIPRAIERLDPVIREMATIADVSPMARLWARSIGSDKALAPAFLEAYHDLNYADAGRYADENMR